MQICSLTVLEVRIPKLQVWAELVFPKPLGRIVSDLFQLLEGPHSWLMVTSSVFMVNCSLFHL